jgi:hypothetical protein
MSSLRSPWWRWLVLVLLMLSLAGAVYLRIAQAFFLLYNPTANAAQFWVYFPQAIHAQRLPQFQVQP